MESNKLVQRDYKKWIIFNDKLGDFQCLYDLYKAVQLVENVGGVACSKINGSAECVYRVEQHGVDNILELVEDEKIEFLKYLSQYYFSDSDIEDWYKQKVFVRDKANNHNRLKKKALNFSKDKSVLEVRPHPKETKYYSLKLVFSILFYVVLVGLIVSYLMVDISLALTRLFIIPLVLMYFLIKTLIKGYFVGIIKGNSIKITETQYQEIFKIVEFQSAQLKLKKMPEIFITGGRFNAFVMRFARANYLMLYSEVIETSLKGDFAILKFVIGHELGHIKRKHLTKDLWLFPSNLVPFLKQAYSRGCEYTCDRIGYHFSNRGAVEGILILAIGKEIYSKISIDQFITDSKNEQGFWVWFSEIFLTHPHLAKRIKGIEDYHKQGY